MQTIMNLYNHSVRLLQVHYSFIWKCEDPERTWNLCPWSMSKHNWTRPSAAQSNFELNLALSRTSRGIFQPFWFEFFLLLLIITIILIPVQAMSIFNKTQMLNYLPFF